MEYEQIKVALSKKNCSVSLLAKAMTVSAAAINGVMKRTTTSKRLAIAICNILEQPPEKVFPETEQYHSNFDPEKHEEMQVKKLREKISSATTFA